MATTVPAVADVCRAAKRAARELATLDSGRKDAALVALADALRARTDDVLAANAQDMQAGADAGLSDALLDRLRLDEHRIEQIAVAVEQIVALEDPVGEVIDGRRLANGLDVRKVRVPLGVVAVVYEARPNVTIDATALCLKSGNAIVLRGSSMAAHSNAALAEIAGEAVVSCGLPPGAVSLLAGAGRQDLVELARQSETVDLIIPRGGEGLKATLQEHATVPVIYAASGNCHIYVDAGADLEEAQQIVLNAKTQRPGVCNAAETLLVHEAVADPFLPEIAFALEQAGVQLRGDERTRARAHGSAAGDAPTLSPDGDAATLSPDGDAATLSTDRDAARMSTDGDAARMSTEGDATASETGGRAAMIGEASEQDWETEYLAPILAIRVVDSLEQALEHIAQYGSGHSEAIVTRDTDAARAFQLGVDAACVYVNASTRFTDGGEFGMGAEIGNSTQKLHARGPIGLRELCTFKYLIQGDGHIRT
ncbi:MAG TPA: glutamate-5-semialdehyde dehydrogenase [Solirubrobacteraceae bacterium]|nr:glutamate-5-semialdehyde dehydrogenase [Solirubrobacteraceae bacterium]